MSDRCCSGRRSPIPNNLINLKPAGLAKHSTDCGERGEKVLDALEKKRKKGNDSKRDGIKRENHESTEREASHFLRFGEPTYFYEREPRRGKAGRGGLGKGGRGKEGTESYRKEIKVGCGRKGH